MLGARHERVVNHMDALPAPDVLRRLRPGPVHEVGEVGTVEKLPARSHVGRVVLGLCGEPSVELELRQPVVHTAGIDELQHSMTK